MASAKIAGTATSDPKRKNTKQSTPNAADRTYRGSSTIGVKNRDINAPAVAKTAVNDKNDSHVQRRRCASPGNFGARHQLYRKNPAAKTADMRLAVLIALAA